MKLLLKSGSILLIATGGAILMSLVTNTTAIAVTLYPTLRPCKIRIPGIPSSSDNPTSPISGTNGNDTGSQRNIPEPATDLGLLTVTAIAGLLVKRAGKNRTNSKLNPNGKIGSLRWRQPVRQNLSHPHFPTLTSEVTSSASTTDDTENGEIQWLEFCGDSSSKSPD